nr:DUF3142 domain-containing protein [Acidobacteriota bacterium]
MREIASYLFFPLIPCFGLLCCGNPLARPASPAKWTTGFWYWNGSSAAVTASVDPVDVIFCQAGTIRNDSVYGQLPEHLPSARDYWLVFRFDSPGVPGLATVPKLTATVAELRETARRRRLNVAGIQLDVDSPTRTLPEYAAFLREVRKELPPELPVSITALLDWFRAGTAIDQVLKEVDEFVPQFYDVQDANDYRGGTAIAKRLDAARWGPGIQPLSKTFSNRPLYFWALAADSARRFAALRTVDVCGSEAAR